MYIYYYYHIIYVLIKKGTKMNESIVSINKSKEVSKRFILSQESFKKLKIVAIENDLDNDGKINQDVLNKALEKIIKEYLVYFEKTSIFLP